MDRGLPNRQGSASIAVDWPGSQGGDLGDDIQPLGPDPMRGRAIYLLGHVGRVSGSHRKAATASAAYPRPFPYPQKPGRSDRSNPQGGDRGEGGGRALAPAQEAALGAAQAPAQLDGQRARANAQIIRLRAAKLTGVSAGGKLRALLDLQFADLGGQVLKRLVSKG